MERKKEVEKKGLVTEEEKEGWKRKENLPSRGLKRRVILG